MQRYATVFRFMQRKRQFVINRSYIRHLSVCCEIPTRIHRRLAVELHWNLNQCRNMFLHSELKCYSSNKSWNLVNHEEPRSAGIIVIGDEILKGQVHDTNSYFIAGSLYKLGLKVGKISVIGDVEEVISKEVKKFSQEYTYVITTGGIGPTHDDITFQLAKAFEESLIPHPELVKLVSDYYKTVDLNSPAMKMAHVPSSAKLRYGYDAATGRKTLYPNVSVRNVYMFPGVPQLMEKLFTSFSQELFSGGPRKFFMKELYLKAKETTIAETLSSVVKEFPQVTIGSYPKLFHSYYSVLVTVESQAEEDMNNAYIKLRAALYKDVVYYDKVPLEDAYEKLQNYIKSCNNPFCLTAVNVIKQCLQEYSPEEICVYFDGDIASNCVLHLYCALIQKEGSIPRIQAVCIKEKQHLPELESFVVETITRYNINYDVFEYQQKSSFLQLSTRQPPIKAVIIGNLSCEQQISDCKKLFEENTDYSNIRWIMPLINWDKNDVWNFIRALTLPYCTLYDQGYTTVGSTKALLQALMDMNKSAKELK
ncbi:FAD synthase isoform X2 [Cryptotermes secundus]|uniref:FAD synthase isoform X2 n=1 Tax=Cryptotermes secundus TaxID=105785 RepID=UPI000CD7C618|nr:FAD synthase isoform X2 [Cryptotermes secundus]